MRLLVTGGAGCLGSNIIAAYYRRGIKILVLDNLATGSKASLPETDNVTFIEGSVADQKQVEKIFENFAPTHVIHAAASYKDPENWQEDINSNIAGTANIIKYSDKYNAEKLIYLQTALCYGRPSEIPVPVNHPLAPFTSYGISKTAGERLLQLAKTPWISLRLANITAPGLSIGPIPTFYKRLKQGKTCFCSDSIRDFLDISDFMALLELCLQASAPCGIFNVSTGEGHTMREVYDVIANYLQTELPEPPTIPCAKDDVQAMVLDPSMTRKKFGWHAKTGFKEMLANILHWYDKYGITEIFSHLQWPDKQ